MNFAFFGTPHFSVIVLQELLRAGDRPALVVTAPDKPVGRKQILTPSPVKEFAMKNGLNVTMPKNVNELFLAMKQCNNETMDFAILAAYGKILPLPKAVFDLFPHGILNIHPSLLPKYRGATPLQTAILDGDTETGVTIIKLNEKIDAGDIVAQEKMAIAPNDTTQTLGDKLFACGAKLLINILPKYLQNESKLISQNNPHFDDLNHRSSSTQKFTKQSGYISLNEIKTAMNGDKNISTAIDRKFRAFTPWPGIWTLLPDGKRVLITKCHLENGVLKIEKVKEEGKEETTNENKLLS